MILVAVVPLAMYDKMKRQLVEGYNGEDWMVGADGVIVCPCGHRIEDDGKCPEGHVSPLRQEGMI